MLQAKKTSQKHHPPPLSLTLNKFCHLKVTQTKHHWWWKANEVFDVLEATKEFNGSFVFLEEDHLLAPDALHLLNLMEQKKIEEKVTF